MTATIVNRLPVDAQALLTRHIEGTREPVDVDTFDAALEVPAEAASRTERDAAIAVSPALP